MKSNAARSESIHDNIIGRKPRGHGDKLGRKAEAAIVALLAHPTMPEAAKAAGVSETTLWRWLQRDDFRKKYREAQAKVFDGALLGELSGHGAARRRRAGCGHDDYGGGLQDEARGAGKGDHAEDEVDHLQLAVEPDGRCLYQGRA